ncbi:hypothetical protein B0O80DRAFT_498393 [Mortierella sp. GBAus27b]|nr:hypothetical protein BGX31_004317 [Mortierella sp. GBA43]KAI8354383.1 hypothetical protein B0O80DRAFT_498393 [Mortierella sp. GBAus27b]
MFESLVAGLLNRFVGPYVTNLNVNQLNIGIWNGDVKLTNLRLKKDALDKFNLPVDITEGYLGELTLNIPWSNLKSKPVKVYINNVYVLCAPRSDTEYNPDEEAARAQALKEERLANADLLSNKSTDMDDEDKKNATFVNQLITKVVDNVQVSINNIHIRFEDKLSHPERPFAAGLTLSQLSAVSTDGEWVPSFIHDEANTIHKLATLDSLALYWNTNSRSLAGQEVSEALKSFVDLIAKAEYIPEEHQYMLKPVSGTGKIKINKRYGGDVPKTGVTLNFDELGFVIDDEQYKSALLLVALFHSFMRQHEHRKFRPPKAVTPSKDPLAWFRYAGNAILAQIHERRRKWTWAYFEERRDDRKAYIELYKNQKLGRSDLEDEERLKALEWKLSYDDIRLYRSMAKVALRREKILIEKKQAAEQPKGWLSSWWYGSSTDTQTEQEESTTLTDAQKKQLYDVIDYDEKAALQADLVEDNDTVLLAVNAKLKTGSFAMKKDPHGAKKTIFSIIFDTFLANFSQRTDNFEAGIALVGLTCIDGSTANTLYPKIIRVKETENTKCVISHVSEGDTIYGGDSSLNAQAEETERDFNPFFSVKFENKPLDGHADSVLAVKMKHLEIIYNPKTVDTILEFLKPPPSEADSVNALLEVAGDTLEGLAAQTRAGLEYALDEHKSLDLRVDVDAPVMIIPQSCTDVNALVVVLDVGHIFVESNLVSKEDMAVVEKNQSRTMSAADLEKLEDLMYDRFIVQLSSTQLLVGQSVERCLQQIRNPSKDADLHVIDKINMTFHVHLSILPQALNLTKIKVFGDLPLLQINFSDLKYKTLMSIVDLVVPKDPDAPAAPAPPPPKPKSSIMLSKYNRDLDFAFGDTTEEETEDDQAAKKPEDELAQARLFQKTFHFSFKVSKFAVTLRKADKDISLPEKVLAELIIERFGLHFDLCAADMKVNIVLGSLYVEDKVEENSNYPYLLSSDADGMSSTAGGSQDLVQVSYVKVNKTSPEYLTKYKGIDATVDISFSTVTMILTRKSVLTLFDFVLTTFTAPAAPAPARPGPVPIEDQNASKPNQPPAPQDTMKVKVKMTSINFILNNDGQRLATMALSRCDVSVLMKPPTMRVNVKLGDFSLTDDINPGGQQILGIQGQELADFAYETFDAQATGYPGYDASVYLRAGSLQLTFLEDAIRQLLDFSTKFARMHVLYDSARNAAVNQAQALQTTTSKFHFDVQISTPIVILPKDAKSRNTIVANLGAISIKNDFADDTEIEGGFLDRMRLEIHSINLLSQFYFGDVVQELPIIEDVDIGFDVIRANHKEGLSRPDMELIGHMSNVSMNLTELQYQTLYAISLSAGRAFGGSGEVDSGALAVSAELPSASQPPPPPPVKTSEGKWTSMDLVFTLPQVTLEVYHGDGTQKEELRDCSFSKFTLSKTDFKYQMFTDSTMHAELTIQDLIINDTRRDVKTKFKEIIPANLHDSPQISLSLNTFDDSSMLVLINVDSPKVIFHLEYIFALQNYFMSAFTPGPDAEPPQSDRRPSITSPTTSSSNTRRPSTALSPKSPEPPKPAQQGPTLHYRVAVISPEIILLANAAISSTDAIILSAHQVVISQQETLTLVVDRIGMFLCKMDKRDDTSLRFIDNFDIALSMGTRSPTPGHQLTNITLDVRPLVLRLSYRDAMLIMDIVNKATELQSQGQASAEGQVATNKQMTHVGPTPRAITDSDQISAVVPAPTVEKPTPKQLTEGATFVTTRETLKGIIQSIQLILIDDLYSLPMLDFKLDRFDLEVKEWSSDMKVHTVLQPSINYFNVRNSHWEPLLEPWQFVVHVSKTLQPPNMLIDVFSKNDLNINITHTFIETALQVMTTIQKEPEHTTTVNREALVPYLIKNRTGYPIHVWAESESEDNTDTVIHKIKDGGDLPWRFDDWRKMRETVTSKKNTLGLQFDGVPWESLKDILVEREGRNLYVLRPKIDSVSHRVAVDIHIKNNVKVVTFSSALLVENATSIPIEVVVVDEKKKHISSVQKIVPGGDYSVPIEDAYKNRLLVRPDRGFNFNWSTETIFWRDLASQQQRQQRYSSARQINSVSCRPMEDASQQSFLFQVRGGTDNFDPVAKEYPYMTIRLSAPVEIENLLPYNIQYKVLEKTTPKSTGVTLTSYLRSGGNSPLHTVDVRNLMLLSIVVENTSFGPSEYSIVSSHDPDELPEENTLTLTDPYGLKLTLGINRHVIPNSGGATKFSIYSPYVIMNKTGLDLVFKPKSFMQTDKIAAGQGKNKDNKAQPLMFSYGKSEKSKRTLVEVADKTQWSQPVSFEAVGSIMEVTMQLKDRKEEIHLGMNVELGKGKYALTKVVTITPRFIIKNNLKEDLCFREASSKDFTQLVAGNHEPLRNLRQGLPKLLSLRMREVTSRWTAPFSIDEMGKIYVPIMRNETDVELIRVNVVMEVATVFIVLNKEEGRWPYRIDNRSSFDISFSQHNPVRNESMTSSTASLSSAAPKVYKLKSHQTVAYSWDFPHLKEKVLVLNVNGSEREVKLQEIGSLMPFEFRTANSALGVMSMDVIAEGPTQVLVLSDYDSKRSLYKRSHGLMSVEERGRDNDNSASKDSGKDGFEVIDVDAVVSFSFQVQLECIGISVLNQRMQELVYLSMTGFELRYKDSNLNQSLNLQVKWLQIDNQLYGGFSPIVLCPTQIPKGEKDALTHPTLHMALVKAKDDTHGVVYFKYFSILIQELTVAMDEDFLFTLLEFTKFNVPGWTEDTSKVQWCEESLALPQITTGDDENQLFFEVLQLQPMKVNLSFKRSDRVNIEQAQQKTSSGNPIMYIFNVLTMAIGNVDGAPISLNALVMENVRASGAVLVSLLQRHYSQDFFFQLYMVVGSIEFLGNPVGLFTNLSSGVKDLFYEPYQGIVMGDSPQDFGLGVVRGTSSLLKKTVFGFSDSIAKISGSVGKGLSAATMDKSFQERRRLGNQRNAPRHALSGLSKGASSLAEGLVSGVTGIVEQPLAGAQKDGVEGFFKGLGKAAVGVVTKPLVGVFDFTTNVTSGIRNTTTVFDKEMNRKRIPRHVPKNGILTLYDKNEALGQYWLKQVDDGRFFHDDYIAHLVLKGDNMVAMLTSKRIMMFRSESLKIEWELEFQEIQSIAPFPRGLSITSRRDRQENFIPIFEQSALKWFTDKIEERVNQFNAEIKPLE